MPIRIAGVTIPQEKRIEVALTYIYGIGRPSATKILQDLKIDPNIRTKNLTTADEAKLLKENFKVEGDLKREVLGNIKRLKEIRSYRGVRHERHLPARGQRTKTNSRTVRGNKRVTLGSGRKPSAQKT
jgi:small subunit ribosomal protein S13